jgi:hypothetical protein
VSAAAVVLGAAELGRVGGRSGTGRREAGSRGIGRRAGRPRRGAGRALGARSVEVGRVHVLHVEELLLPATSCVSPIGDARRAGKLIINDKLTSHALRILICLLRYLGTCVQQGVRRTIPTKYIGVNTFYKIILRKS